MAPQFHIIAVGKMKPGPLLDLYNEYIKRIDWPVHLSEITIKSSLKHDEARELFSKIPDHAKVIALDEKGESISSINLSKQIGQWSDHGAQNIAFVIGGADGLDQLIFDRADLRLSFGRLTWPHMLVRVMLSEQIYRLRSILKNHPYHRE